MPVTLDLSGALTRFEVLKPKAQLCCDSLLGFHRAGPLCHIFVTSLKNKKTRSIFSPGCHKLISNKQR